MARNVRLTSAQDAEKQASYPRQADQGVPFNCRSSQSRALLLVERAHMRVDEDIGIHQDHLLVSPSAMLSASAMLSMPAIRSRPSATDRVRTAPFGPAAHIPEASTKRLVD